ncbi:PD40 domain-containing protein [Litoribacter ruber]|uniref:PD40 domain-containing protein n=1 Tax=Litoribacter ruber TaxID=702568 RepID=UPI001BDA7E2D|nr:PD40 domain-containing protein [Litoribacter ruber]MBT0810881.1 PD40 domain-containing protein [Litoribacter ruber]
MKLRLLLVLSFVLLFGFTPETKAQFDRERFGKNRVQHKNMEWSYYSSNNFEVYYYDGGQAKARMAIDYLESQFDRITQMIGYVAYTKPKVFIYNSREDLLQSNLNLNKNEYTVDGQTYFSKLLAEVPFTGQYPEFKEELIYGVSKAIIEEMLYGSSIADAFQSNLINSFPEWFVDGAALYLAKGWSREMDDFVRHYLHNNPRPRMHRLRDEEAGLVGQSIWNFIVEKYGRRYISSILNLSRINRNEENSIANTIGINYRNFSDQWRGYYVGLNEPVLSTFKSINEDKVITTTSPRRQGSINDVKFSPDGKNLAYVQNTNGKYRVVVRDLSSGRERAVYRGGYNVDDQRPNFTSPVIAWKDTLNLAIATFRRGTSTLRLRAIDGSGQDKIFLRNLTQILDIDFNSNGRNMVLSAISNGKTEIYTLNMRGQGRRLTNDVFDNISPVFLNDSTIVFSSNRTDLPDSLLNERIFDISNLADYYNLFRIDVGDSVVTTRLTNTNTKNFRPKVLNRNFVLHLSDQSGIMNVSRYGLGSSVSSQVSAFNKSLIAFDYSPQTNQWAYSVQDGIQSKLVVETFPNLDQFTPSTPRVQLAQAKLLNERTATRRDRRETPAERRTQQRAVRPDEVVTDTITPAPTVDINLDDLLIGGGGVARDTVPTTPQTGTINTDRLRFEGRGGIDTDNYVFDTVPEIDRSTRLAGAGRSSALDAYRQQTMQKRVTGPNTYVPRFIASSLNTNFVVDPLRGFGVSLNAEMTDLLDNHAFRGGIMTTLDFRSGSDVFFEYEYLKQRIDVRGRFDRRAVLWSEGIETYQRYVLTKTELGFSYPFTVHSRVMLAPFVAKTQYFNLNPDSIIRGGEGMENRLDINYAGGRAEFVVDRTNQLGLYMQQGFKGKIGFVHYQGLNESQRSFSNAYLDLRNYQKVSKNITLATRLFAGSFFGNNPQTYMVGGMDNWLFNQFYEPPANRPEASPVRNPTGRENTNLLFAEFVDLRGYDYDEIRGNNVITFSAELRIPIFSYLSRGNIASNFVKNFQLVGFYDAGSSWNEAAPWERINDRNTEVIDTEGSPFNITVNNFSNPWLQSYGAGLRTVLLNYYVKFDVARPVRDYTVERPRFYVTLGYNF